MGKAINITIVDQSSIIREGLISMLNKLLPALKIETIKSSADICQYIEDNKPQIVIINPAAFAYNRGDKISVLRQCANKSQSKLTALVYAYFDENTLQAFDEVIYIEDTQERIKEKINALIKRKKENKQETAESILSQREIDVLKLLALGLSNKEIAEELNISTHTAISHRKNITSKLGVRSTSGLTIYAVINKLINEEDYHKSI